VDGPPAQPDNAGMRARVLTSVLLALAVHQASLAQPASSFATPARDSAAVFVAMSHFAVGRLGSECLAIIGRAESGKAFADAWKDRNAMFVAASTRYLDQRVEEAGAQGGPERRASAQREILQVVQASGENLLRTLLQGRREDGCMNAVTLVETGVLDINTRLPQYSELEALVLWNKQ
jgi:hypothetical protein